jgi:hypothetical protein
MTIYNCDGRPYRPTGSVQQFSDQLPEHQLFNQWDEEAIKWGGSPIFYYELFVNMNNIDPLYLETRTKIYSPQPVQLWCYYEPVPSQNFQTPFGIDSPDDMLFEFNYKATLDKLGHVPKIGSRFFTPFLKENWVIIERKTGEMKMYGVVRLQCLCQRFQEDSVSGTSVNESQNVNYKIV